MKKVKIAKSLTDKVGSMLKHFDTHGFTTLTSGFCKYNAFGQSLQHNILQEWLLSNTVTCDEPTFRSSCAQITDIFSTSKNHSEKLPFSCVTVMATPNVLPFCGTVDEESKEVDKCFNHDTNTELVKHSFRSPSEALSSFHSCQRQRSMWWRKFSALPGRFSLTEVTNLDTEKGQHVEVQAVFPWGHVTVETISYTPEMLSQEYEVKEGRRRFIPQVITHKTSLEKATAVYLCDAYEPLNEETAREMLRFHRKLSPFKVSFAVSSSAADASEELSDLCLLLARKIRNTGSAALLLPEMNRRSLEYQFKRNDALGIPYTVVLNDQTLKDGILAIRSRDTTLKEQSHISDLTSYIQLLMKNY